MRTVARKSNIEPSRDTQLVVGQKRNEGNIEKRHAVGHAIGAGHDFSRVPVQGRTSVRLQPRLTYPSPDIHEQEADRASTRVMRGADANVGTEATPAPVPAPAVGPDARTGGVPPLVHEALRSEGRPLDAPVRGFMQDRFDHDFSRVRVHTGGVAAESARAVNALAYTVGPDIVFGAGTYAPTTAAGGRLLAHELTHVVQQSAASAPGGDARGVLQRKPDDASVAPATGASTEAGPTIGNLPRDSPRAADRFRLEFSDGKWREVRPGRKEVRTAKGTYNFVLVDGEIWAVKHSTRISNEPPPGHTEAAGGGRVTWAGQVRFNKHGQVAEWNEGSGHYRPASTTRDPVVKAGFPDDKFSSHPEVVAAKQARPQKGPLSQLPVQQPPTRSRDGGKPKVPPGPSRMEDLLADLAKATSKTPAADPPQAPKTAPATTVASGQSVSTGVAGPKVTVPDVDVAALPKVSLKGAAKAAGKSALSLLAAWLLGNFATRATEQLLQEQIEKLEPSIRKDVEAEANRILATGWAGWKPRPRMSVFVRLDISRLGSYEGELYDYFWSLPTVSVKRVVALPAEFGDAFPEAYGTGVSGPEFDRIGLGVLDEHHYYTFSIPLETLIAP